MTLTTYDDAGGLLDRARLGHRRPDQDLQPDRHPEVVPHRRRPDGHRRRRLGPAAGHRQGRGPHRRRRLAGRPARPGRRRRLLAPVVPPLDADARPAHPRGARHHADGDVQTAARATPFPEGSSGIQDVVVTGLLTVFPRIRAIRIRPQHRMHLSTGGRKVPTSKGLDMMRTITRTTGLAAMALTLSLGLAACGNEDDDSAADAPMESSSSTPMETPSESAADDMGTDAAAPFGAGCSAIPTEGAGSVDSMATEPVATAASREPAADHPGRRRRRGRPGRHPELRRGADRLRPDRRRVRRDPQEERSTRCSPTRTR